MVETAEAKQVSRAASSVLFAELDFGVTDNGTYPSEDFQRVLTRIAFDNKFVNAGAKAYQIARGDDVDVGAESRNRRINPRCAVILKRWFSPRSSSVI
jgi:hypothetical protein